MSNVYENLGSGNFNSHIDSDGQNGGMVIDNKPTIGHEIKKTLIKAGAAGLAMGSLGMAAACAPAEAVTPNPESTQIVVVDNSDGMAVHTSNEAPTEVTPSPSPEPTETPTPTLDEFGFSEERKAELNQQIQDFLDEKGDFTKEKKSEMSMLYGLNKELESTELGLIFHDPRLEGYFFDYFEKDGNLVLLMGFDGKDGNSFVTPLEIPLNYLKNQPNYSFSFAKLSGKTMASEFAVIKKFTDGNVDGFSSYLDKIKGGVIVIQPSIDNFSGDYDGIIADYIAENNSKTGLSGKLVSLVPDNGIKIDANGYKDGTYDDYEILKISNLEEAKDIDLSKVPLIDPVILTY